LSFGNSEFNNKNITGESWCSLYHQQQTSSSQHCKVINRRTTRILVSKATRGLFSTLQLVPSLARSIPRPTTLRRYWTPGDFSRPILPQRWPRSLVQLHGGWHHGHRLDRCLLGVYGPAADLHLAVNDGDLCRRPVEDLVDLLQRMASCFRKEEVDESDFDDVDLVRISRFTD
jgi:hypothetical protein